MPPTPESEVNQTPDDIVIKYKEILKSNGITDEVSEVIVKTPDLKNEGFASMPHYVTINFVDPKLKPLNLFAKTHTRNTEHSKFLDDSNVFPKEASFLMKYVPAAKEFCKSKGQHALMDLYPKCYYGDEQLIVLENLVLDRGFELLKKEEMQDLEAARLAITTLAKHHALSHAMIMELGGPQNFFNRFPKLDFQVYEQKLTRDLFEPVMESGYSTNIKLLEKNDVDGRESTIALLKELMGKSYDLLLKAMKNEPDDKFLVLNHGDYWNNNMMFLRDKQTQKLNGHIAIDFQITQYGSPGIDIGYFLYTSVKPKVRRAHLQDLLNLYLDVLKQTATSLDHSIDLTYEELFLTFRKKIDFGYWSGFCFTSEAGYAALKEFDMEAMEEMGDWSKQFDASMQKWIDNNPEKGKELARNIVELVNEYRELSIE